MDTADKSEALTRLARMIQRVEDRFSPTAGAVPTGWAPVDETFLDDAADPPAAGLRLGGVHEFSLRNEPLTLSPWERVAFRPGEGAQPGVGSERTGLCNEPSPQPSPKGRGRIQNSGFRIPDSPAALLVHLASQAAATIEGHVVWAGKRCWPNPQFLSAASSAESAGAQLLERSLFVDAADPAARLWAIEVAMRSPAVSAVIGDSQGFRLPATRRLELAARNARGLVLLARPARELHVPSAAMTRWAVASERTESLHPAWTLELLHSKARTGGGDRRWLLEWDRAKGAVVVSAELVGRVPETPAAAARRSTG